MKTEQRVEFDRWVQEKYPLVYNDYELHEVRDWVDFAYICYLQGANHTIEKVQEFIL